MKGGHVDIFDDAHGMEKTSQRIDNMKPSDNFDQVTGNVNSQSSTTQNAIYTAPLARNEISNEALSLLYLFITAVLFWPRNVSKHQIF